MIDLKHNEPFELFLMPYKIEYEKLELYTVVANYDWSFVDPRKSI